MGGAAQAGVVGANRHLDAVEQPFADFATVEIFARYGAHRLVHRLVVVRGADDEVAPLHQVVIADRVVVDQGAARGLDHTHASAVGGALRRQRCREFAAQQRVILQQFGDHFHGMQHLDHARPVVGQCGVHRAVGQKALARTFCARAGDMAAVVHARERADPVPACLAPERAQVGKFHVGPGFCGLFDQPHVALHVDPVVQDAAFGIAHAQHSVVKLHGAIGAHERHPARADAAEVRVERRVLGVQAGHQLHGLLAPVQHLRHLGGQLVAFGAREVAVHPPRYRTGAVHALARREADHLLPELAQQDALACDVRVRGGDADDVAPRCIAVKAEKQVGRGQVKKVQCMRLHHLPVVHQAAHGLSGVRYGRHAQRHVDGLAGSQMV